MKILELVKAYEDMLANLAEAQSMVRKAECHLSNAANALGKYVLPCDARVGEQFCIPLPNSDNVGLRFLQITKRPNSENYEVVFRGGKR